MQINNWVDIAIYSFFTLSIIFIGFPISIYLLRKGAQGAIIFGFLKKLPNNYLIVSGLGTYPLEIIFYGLFIFIFSVWYLFFESGGNLVNLICEIKTFFTQ